MIESAGFDIRQALAEIEQKIYLAYFAEMTNGKGIAKIQAADRLREWADTLGVHDNAQVPGTVSFLPVDVDQSGKIVRMETA